MGQAKYQDHQVCHSQREEIVVGSRVHGPVSGDDQADSRVAKDPCEEDGGVHHGHGYHYLGI